MNLCTPLCRTVSVSVVLVCGFLAEPALLRSSGTILMLGRLALCGFVNSLQGNLFFRDGNFRGQVTVLPFPCPSAPWSQPWRQLKEGGRDCSGNEGPEPMGRGLEAAPLTSRSCWPQVSVTWAAVAENHSLVSLNDQHSLLTALEAEGPRPGVRVHSLLRRSLLPGSRTAGFSLCPRGHG